jgi:hypothetical protein
MRATWATSRYLFDLQADKVRTYFGFKPQMDPMSSFIRAALIYEKNKRKASNSPAPSTPVLTPAQRSTAGTQDTSSSQKVDSSTSTNPDHEKSELSKLPFPVPQGEGVPITLNIFLHNMHQAQQKTPVDPPRGCIEIKGLVEVVARKRRLILDVTATYDIQANKYLNWTYKPKHTMTWA